MIMWNLWSGGKQFYSQLTCDNSCMAGKVFIISHWAPDHTLRTSGLVVQWRGVQARMSYILHMRCTYLRSSLTWHASGTIGSCTTLQNTANTNDRTSPKHTLGLQHQVRTAQDQNNDDGEEGPALCSMVVWYQHMGHSFGSDATRLFIL